MTPGDGPPVLFQTRRSGNRSPYKPPLRRDVLAWFVNFVLPAGVPLLFWAALCSVAVWLGHWWLYPAVVALSVIVAALLLRRRSRRLRSAADRA